MTVQSNGTSQVGTPYHLACQIGNGLTPSIGPVVYEWTSTCSGECFILRQPGTATASTQYLKAVDSGTHTCTVTDSVGNQGSASVNVSATGKMEIRDHLYGYCKCLIKVLSTQEWVSIILVMDCFLTTV